MNNPPVVLDTMAVVLRLEKLQLPSRVRAFFEQAEQGNRNLFIPAMVALEIGYLSVFGYELFKRNRPTIQFQQMNC